MPDELHNLTRISKVDHTINKLAQSAIYNDFSINRTLVCVDSGQHVNANIIAEPILKSHQGTHAQAMISNIL